MSRIVSSFTIVTQSSFFLRTHYLDCLGIFIYLNILSESFLSMFDVFYVLTSIELDTLFLIAFNS